MSAGELRLKTVDGVGVTLNYKLDKKLFRRYTKNASRQNVPECLFADDGALLASTREGAERAVVEYETTIDKFGLRVSIPKTKHLVVGSEAEDEDKAPITVEGGEIEGVEEFPYLGSIIASSGAMDPDVYRRVAQAFCAFGALRKAVFLDKDLTLTTKRKVYQACVLSVLLYGAECWTLFRRHTRKLNSFHHRCIRIILGISNHEQWTKCITIHKIRRKWGDDDTAEIKVAKRRLQWLGHLARMPDHRLPNVALFSSLSEPRPRCGLEKRWRDAVRKDPRVIEVHEDKWYDEAATSRASWRALCRDGLESSNRTSTSQRE